MREITIGGRVVRDDTMPFIVAEVGINHNGRLETALQMIDAAKTAGADAVKFQTFRASELVANREQMFTYRSQGKDVTESMLAMFERYELPVDAWKIIKAACEKAGLLFFSTPQNRTDLDVLLDVGVPAIKVGSDDFTNLPLLRSYAATKLPLILSCGMSTLAEVYASLDAVGAFEGYPVALLLCTSQYPTPPADVHLRKLETLRAALPDTVIGFSDHTEGHTAATGATALGARIFEKHFTLDRNLPGPDHWFSEDPRSLEAWCSAIRDAYTMLGSAVVRPTATESANRMSFRRYIVASRAIAAGDAFDERNTMMRRHPAGILPASSFDLLAGRRASRSFAAGEPIDL